MKKRKLILASVLAIGTMIGTIPTNMVSAATVTNEQVASVKAQNEAYRKALSGIVDMEGQYDDGSGNMVNFKSAEFSNVTKFELQDVTGDGIDELVVEATQTDYDIDSTTKICENTSLAVYFMDAGEAEILTNWPIDPEISMKIDYCANTKAVLVTSQYSVSIWPDNTPIDVNDYMISSYRLSINFVDTSILQAVGTGAYYKFGEKEVNPGTFDWVTTDATQEEIAEYQSTYATYLPTLTELKTPSIANTAENLDNYFPVDEAAIRIALGDTSTSSSTDTDTNADTDTDTDSDTTSSTPDSTLNATGSIVIALDNTSGILPAGTTFAAEKLTSGTLYDSAIKLLQSNASTANQFSVFELDLKDQSGVEIHQLNGKVTFTLAPPFTVTNGYTLKVYRVDGDNLVECPVTLTDGNLTVETDHFSTYIFTEEKVAPKTGDTNFNLLWILCLAFGGSFILLYKKKLVK